MKKLLLSFLWCLLCFCAAGQVEPDSTQRRQDTPTVRKKDTGVVNKRDSVPGRDTGRLRDSLTRAVRRDTTTVRKVVPKPADSARKADAAPPVIIPSRDVPDKPPPPDTIMAISTIEGELLPGLQTDTMDIAGRVAMVRAILKNHPYYNFHGKPIVLTVRMKKVNGREAMFYFLAGLLIYFGFIRMLFGKYLANLATLFFRVTMRQQQIRDQLLQSPLPSLLLNLLFFINGGFFLSFVALHYNIVPISNQWIVAAWSAALLIIIYLGKFIILKITGWVFNIRKVAETYIFIVFLVNKMISIFLLPVLVILAFAGPVLFKVVLTLTFVILVIFFIYRFIIAYKPIRNEIKVNSFHFFIYLCAFEIAPLLLIYKVLLIFVERSY